MLFVIFNLFLSTDYSFSQSQNEIINIRAGKHTKFYRIVVESSKKVEALVELKKDPYRAIIKIPESLWRANSTPRKGNFFPNIPVSYSFRNNEIGKTNLILNVNKPFSLDKIYWLSKQNGEERLVIDIYYSSETDFLVTQKSFNDFSKEQFELILDEKPNIEEKNFELFKGRDNKVSSTNNFINQKDENIDPTAKENNFLVVIDPGHGGKDPGSVGYSKTLEKDVNLYASKILHSKLNNIRGIKAFLTRSEDNYIQLHERYKIANQLRADIFISLHSDAVKSKSVTGYSIFSLNKDPDIEKANFQKNQKNQNVLGNVVLDNEILETQNVLYKMYQRRKRNYSIKLKNLILEEFKSLPTNSRGSKEENFAVLNSPVIPSVLIEMGFLSNKNDEKKLNDHAYISNLMERISMAVLKYKNVYMK
ncbi:MAG: N-acetylmuramoyl-L-alanine amidase [Candidatus Puniceispirillales bacterium]